MNEIRVTVTIPDFEYEGWSDFEKGGEDECQKTIEADIKRKLRELYIENFDIDSTVNNR